MKIATGYAHDPAKAQELIQAKLVESGVLNPDGSVGPAGVEVGPGVTFPGTAPAGSPTATSPPEEQSASGREDPATRLRKLQELHRDGLITEEEYAGLRLQILTEL